MISRGVHRHGVGLKRLMGRRRARITGLIALLVMSSGCLYVQPDAVRRAHFEGDPFHAALRAAYLDVADFEHAHQRHRQASLFAYKARVASRGDPVAPEALDDWRVPREARAALNSARTRLILSLSESQGQYALIHAARAQVMFDCWLVSFEADAMHRRIQGRRALCEREHRDALKRLDEELEKL